MPARSKNGLCCAMVAVVSMFGVLHLVRVSLTSFCPRPVVRYLGCVMTRLMLLSFWFSSVMGIFGSALFLPDAAAGGYVYTMMPIVSLPRCALKILRMAPGWWLL